MSAPAILLLTALLVACGGGMSGEYSDKDGAFTYNFKGSRVEMSVEFMGNETQNEMAYEFSDHKSKMWNPASPEQKQVFRVDDEGCFNGGMGMLTGKICPKDSWKSWS